MRFLPPLIFSILLAILAGCGKTDSSGERASEKETTLTLFVAASLTDVIQEVGDAFASEHEVEFVYNFAGSGTLAQQLLASPRADVFISANERWMDEVASGERIVPESRRTILSNRLCIIAHPTAKRSISGPEDLCTLPFRYLAVGDPGSVPAGRYAREWLRSLHCPDGSDIWSTVEGHISPAPDVRAALTQVQGSRDVIGVVYQTDYFARKDQVQLLYTTTAEECPKIHYSAAIIRDREQEEMAAIFLRFLTGPEAVAIFQRCGFIPVATSADNHG